MELWSDGTESTQPNGRRDGEKSRENNAEQKKSTPFSKAFKFDKYLKFSRYDYKLTIESGIKNDEELKIDGEFKFLKRPAYPDEEVLAKLARRVYKEKDNGGDLIKGEEMPNGWKLLTTAFNNKTDNSYFGAAYWNPEKQQIVVAHRGSILTKIGVWLTDYYGILHNNYVPQMASAITFADKIKVMVEELNKRENVFLQLSFTGHSLGGWLAQITTLTTKYFGLENVDGKDLFVKSPRLGYHAHTVVFDSPGCKEMLSQIRDSFELRYGTNRDMIFISDLDITTYLSAPNLVNTCNLHIGTLYRVFIENPPSKQTPFNFKYTSKMHSSKELKNVFSSDRINETQRIIDWPSEHKGIRKRGLEVFFPITKSPTNNEFKYFLEVAEGVDDYNPKPDDISGYCKIRYQLEKVNKAICYTNVFSQPELDFLTKYQLLRKTRGKDLKNVFTSIGDKAKDIQNTLKHFEREDKVEIIRCESEDQLKKLIRYVKFIIRFIPGITDRIQCIQQNDPIWFRMEQPLNMFVGRTIQLKTLLQVDIHREQRLKEKRAVITVITGLDGVGKSELTIKYVHEHYAKDNSVVWIDAKTEKTQKRSFIQLHEQLNLKSRVIDEEENMESIINDVYKYLTVNSEKSIFVFDNAENYTAIKKFLPSGLSDCEKVHVVVTSSNNLEWKPKRATVETLTLEDFTDEEAIEFIKKSLKITNQSQDEDIKHLIKKLNNFPLALQQAVAYIKTMNEEHKISDYLTKYEQEPQKVLSAELESEDRNGGVLSTLNMIINKIKASGEFGQQALNILDTISFFAPSNIPGEIFLNRFTSVDELPLIIQQLTKYSIVRKENGMLNVHGLVQQIRKLQVKKEEREEKILKSVLALLTEHIAVREHNKHETNPEKKEREKKEREKIELCTPHIVSVWNHAYEYINLIEEFLVRGKKIIVPGTETDLSVTYFNFIAAGSKYEIVKEIINKIEEKFPNDRNKVKNFINRRNDDKESALHGAAQNSMEQTVELLVSKGADVNAKKKYGWTPLSLAVNNGHLKVVKYLLENGAKIGIHRTSSEHTELHLASKNGYVEIVKLLLNKGGAHVDISQKDAQTDALQKDAHVDISKKGANKKTIQVPYVNAQDKHQHTPLHFAVKKNYLEIIKVLLEDERIDVNAETELKRTPLYFAVKTGNLESVKILIKNGAKVNAKNRPNDFTPVHRAALDGNIEIFTYLLEKVQIDIDAQTSEGNTALHLAAKNGNLPVVEILIERNADASIVNNEGKLAIDLAHEKDHVEVKNYIADRSEFGKERSYEDQLEQDLQLLGESTSE